jgi:hypothetical protein
MGNREGRLGVNRNWSRIVAGSLKRIQYDARKGQQIL